MPAAAFDVRRSEADRDNDFASYRGDFVSNLPPGFTGRTGRSGFPMKWSFSVTLASNVLMAVIVAASGDGRVGILAVCAVAVVSLVLIIAEGIASR